MRKIARSNTCCWQSPKPLSCKRHRDREASLRPAQDRNAHWCPSHAVTIHIPQTLLLLEFSLSVFQCHGVHFVLHTHRHWLCLCSVITDVNKGRLLDWKLEFSHNNWLFQTRAGQGQVFSPFRRKEMLSKNLLHAKYLFTVIVRSVGKSCRKWKSSDSQY